MSRPTKQELGEQIEYILAASQIIEPVITAHLDDLHMDTPEDEALLDKIRDLVQPWAEAVRTFSDTVKGQAS